MRVIRPLSSSMKRCAGEEAEMRAALQSKDALADVLGIVELGARQFDLGFTVLRLQDDVVGDGVLVGNAQVLGLENDAVDQHEISVVHQVDELSHFSRLLSNPKIRS